MMGDWLWAAVGFLFGSLPLAVWIGKVGLKKDIRQYGDGNPGSINVIRAGGFAWAGLALMLEIGKGALPVGLATYIAGVEGVPLIAAAIAPPFGHAFSPFLRFRGGKAIATSLGIWIGLTIWVAPIVGVPALVFWSLMLTVSAWAVMFTLGTVTVYLLAIGAPTIWLMVWALNVLLLIYKHRHDLRQPPRLKFLRPQESS